MGKRSWEQVVRGYLASGEPLTKYCRRRRLPYSATYYWVRKLGDRDVAKRDTVAAAATLPAKFVEVATLPMQEQRSTTYSIVLNNGRRLEVDAGFDAAVVASIVRVCESC